MGSKFNHEQSVELIKEMILQAKGNITEESGNYFLLWGHIYFIAPLLHFIIIRLAISDYLTSSQLGSYTGIMYGVAIAIGIIGQIILTQKEKNVRRTKTYADSIMSNIWIGFGVAVAIIYLTLIPNNSMLIYPSITFGYTFALYMSSVVLKFKKLLISVAICVCCIISYRFVPAMYYPLVMAVAMLAGNVIPGYLLKYYSKRDV